MNVNPKPPEENPAEWLRFAASDLAFARLGKNDSDILPAQIGFHAQQAAEKAIKGAMVHRGVMFPKTHDLDELIHLWVAAGRAWPAEFDGISEMTVFAMRSRYPGDIDPPTRAEVMEAIELAEKILAWAESIVPPPSSEPDKRT